MTRDELISHAQYVPFVRRGRSLRGFDCLGFVEYWYQQILGIEIKGRTDSLTSPLDLEQGYSSQNDWITLPGPENDCVALMETIDGGVRLKFGHCGIFWAGRVYHFQQDGGFQYISLDDPQSRRVTEWVMHKDRR